MRPGATSASPREQRPVGLVQAHGFLLAVDPATAVIEIASANLDLFLGVSADVALGRTLGELFGAVVAGRLPGPGSSGPGDTQPQVVQVVPLVPGPDATGLADPGGAPRGAALVVGAPAVFEVVAHHGGRLWVLEFEPAVAEQDGGGSLYDTFRRTLDGLRSVAGLEAQCAAAADEVRALTGYDRVLVYRVDQAGAEEKVIADAHGAGMESRLGMSYPATAAQRAARAGYLRSWIECVADVGLDPVELWSTPQVAADDAVDLTLAVLRPVFPVNRRALRLQGVRAALTVSLIIDGRLWGLLSCQHRTPRRVPQQMRASCGMLGRVLSLQIRAEMARRDHDQREQLIGVVGELVAVMAGAESLTGGAAGAPSTLLGVVDADGAVLQVDGVRVTAGNVPDGRAIDEVLARVVLLAGDEVPPWTTDALPRLEVAAGLPGHGGGVSATGVLYLPLGGRNRDFALWLRGEEVRTIVWVGGAGDPGVTTSAPVVDPGEPSGHHSEAVHGTSRPWTPAERAAAEAFATALPALLLNRAQRVLVEHERAAAADRVSAAAERQQLERQLHQNERLESLGHLAGGVAHDFNNLLAVILNYTDFVADAVNGQVVADQGGSWLEVQEDLEQVRGATRRAADLTRQLLAFARREVLEVQPVNLDQIIRKLEHLLRRTLGERIELVTDLAVASAPVLADPGQIEQIVVNLAVNARDAMTGGGCLTITTRPVDHVASTGTPAEDPGGALGGRVMLRVGDTGTGMPQEIIDRVFEPFFTTKASGDGTGLGLATVQRIVHEVGGTIEIDSAPGLGTTFTMVFPATDRRPPAPPQPEASVPGRGGGQTVLLVEDGDDVREVTRRLLAEAGYTVLTAVNGYQAIAAAADHPTAIDLLVTDLIMPFMSGDEVAGRLRTLYPGLRVLFMSGYAAPLLTEVGSLRSGYPLLDKPFSRPTLLSRVLDVLESAPTPLPDVSAPGLR